MIKRIGGVALVGLILAAIWSFAGWRGAGPLDHAVRVSVPEGSSVHSLARLLAKQGAISSSRSFVIFARLFGSGSGIKAGTYRLKAHESAADILAQIEGGKTVQQLVTIPEGMPSVMVRDRLMAETALTGDIPVPAEGSVLPESYSFDEGEARADVLKRMQAAMTKTLAEAWANRSANTAAKSPEQAVTLASIIEKETAVAAERPVVAGVYTNRLRLGMRLQADPTVIYPITKGKPLGRRIRKSELESSNPYNTYRQTGLPPGPIANPGKAAIIAALNPADTPALYFVANGQGGHIFSQTLDQQNANVHKWFALRRARGEM